MTIRDRTHHASDLEARRGMGQRSQHRPSFQTRTVERLRSRVEVVEVPGRLEVLDVIGFAPDVEVFAPVSMMRRGLDGVTQCHENSSEEEPPRYLNASTATDSEFPNRFVFFRHLSI